MNIISDFTKDVCTQKPKPGSYEWWYFDAQSADGYTIVIIFYEGNPFSKKYIHAMEQKAGHLAENFPAISVSVYKNAQPVYYSFEEMDPGACNFSAHQPEGNVGKNRFKGELKDGQLVYSVELDQTLASADNIFGWLTFRSGADLVCVPEVGISRGGDHLWNLVQPSCEVTGELTIKGHKEEVISFYGRGYHDHNFGSEPMKESFDEWYWGRYHLDDATFVYYLMLEKGHWQKNAWLIHDDGSVMTIDRQISISGWEWSLFGLKTARVFTFECESYKAVLHLDKLTDNGPFYQRFNGRLLAGYQGKAVQTRGISEYLKPARIYNRLFWPLVDMRIKYPGEAHWVQKKPRLYRWTW